MPTCIDLLKRTTTMKMYRKYSCRKNPSADDEEKKKKPKFRLYSAARAYVITFSYRRVSSCCGTGSHFFFCLSLFSLSLKMHSCIIVLVIINARDFSEHCRDGGCRARFFGPFIVIGNTQADGLLGLSVFCTRCVSPYYRQICPLTPFPGHRLYLYTYIKG